MKKVLIITYYWPPSAGGGVQRWLKFAKYLPQYGWEPVIYTPSNPDFNLTDDSLLGDVPPDLTVIKREIWEPYGLLRLFSKKAKGSSNVGQVSNKGAKKKILSWVRGNLFIPDPRKFWKGPSIKFLSSYLVEQGIATIVTTGPPHSMHLIGLGLKKKLPNLKWIVDIRDPWSGFDMLDNFLVSTRNRKKYQSMEEEVLRASDAVTATSPSMKTLLRPFDHQKFEGITNGYDRQDFINFQDRSSSTELIIYHAGLINDLRNPENFLTALDAYCNQEKAIHKATTLNLKLHLVGIFEKALLETIAKLPHISEALHKEAYKDHSEVLADYESASVLLLLVNNTDNAKVNIPGKTFEYLATGKPIICISDLETDVVKILNSYPHSLVFSYAEKPEIILPKLSLFLKTLPKLQDKSQVLKHSRKALSQKMSDVLNRIQNSHKV